MAEGGSNSHAAVLAIYAALAYDVIAATNSSPQTTEINASARADTLMKWVNIGMAQVALLTLIGVALQKAQGEPVWPPMVGAGLGAGLMYAQYVYARNAGLKDNQAGTETYGQ